MSTEKTIKAYKGFNSDMTCRGFQYEVGKEYEIEGDIKVCERGFHACESPLEVLDHYQIFGDNGENRFCKVEQSGTIDKEENSTKVCSSKINIKAELKLSDLINLGVEWIKEQVKLKKDNNISDNSGDSAKIGSSGYSAKIDSAGESSVICCAGNNSIVKAKIGSWITLSEWVYSYEKNRNIPKFVKTVYVDGDIFQADTWYKLVDGEFKDVKP